MATDVSEPACFRLQVVTENSSEGSACMKMEAQPASESLSSFKNSEMEKSKKDYVSESYTALRALQSWTNQITFLHVVTTWTVKTQISLQLKKFVLKILCDVNFSRRKISLLSIWRIILEFTASVF
jgi:hypothetical protein